MTNTFHHRYYKLNKLLLSLIGLWPYQSRARRYALFAIFVLLGGSQLIPMIIAVVEYGDDSDLLMESIPPLSIAITCTIKVFNIFFNSDKGIVINHLHTSPQLSAHPLQSKNMTEEKIDLIFGKQMLKLAERIKFDWMSLIYQPEIHELQRYAEAGKQFIIAYIVVVTLFYVIYMTQPAIPQILVAFNLIDESQTKKFPFPVDYYGIDFEKYYYYMLGHSCICVALATASIIAVDAMCIMQIQHACGMFTIVGLQLEKMGDVVPERYEPHPLQPKDQYFQQMAACLKRHDEVIKFANMLENTYNWSFLGLLVINTVLMSIVGFQVTIKLHDSIYDAVKYAVFTLTELILIFFHNLFSQRLIEHSEQIHDYICQAKWYRMSLSMQKLISIVIMRTYIPCQLTAGKFMVMSLENFTLIVKTSISYFTLLRSTQ